MEGVELFSLVKGFRMSDRTLRSQIAWLGQL